MSSCSWFDELLSGDREQPQVTDWDAFLFGAKVEREVRRGTASKLAFGDITELEALPENKYKNDTKDGRTGEMLVIRRLNEYGFDIPIEDWHKHEPGKQYDQKDILVNGHRLEVKYIRNDDYPFGDTPESFKGKQLLVAKVASIEKHVHRPLAYVFVHATTGGILALPFTEEVTDLFYERQMFSDGKEVPGAYLGQPQKYLKTIEWLVEELTK